VLGRNVVFVQTSKHIIVRVTAMKNKEEEEEMKEKGKFGKGRDRQ
jgi:hypothetical protein